MRLIDADELKKVIFSKTDSMEDLWDTAGVLNAINNAPTVAEIFKSGSAVAVRPIEERPTGEWIEKVETKQFGCGWLTTHEIVCSVCGGSGENDENIPQCWKFCPACGARMTGGKEE